MTSGGVTQAGKRTVQVGDRFVDALGHALRLHAGDVRKGTTIPYVGHLLSVCGLVLSDGGDEDEAIAALLHDALEDHPEAITRADVAARWGERVRAMVEACTDTPVDWSGGQKPPWRTRKEAYLEHVRRADPALLRVSVADKLDNARAILADLRILGDALWVRFNAGAAEQLWYLRSLVDAFETAGTSPALVGELRRVVAQIEGLVASGR